MKYWGYIAQCVTIACLFPLNPISVSAACTLPNNLTNGQLADAGQVMGNFTTLPGCVNGNGSVNSGTAGQIGTYSSGGSTISGETPSRMLDSSFGTTQGSILYRGSSGWAALTPGTSGQVLATASTGR